MKTNCTSVYLIFLLIIIGAAVIEAGREAGLDVHDKSVERSPRKRRFDSESYERHVYGRELSNFEKFGGGYGYGYPTYNYNPYGYGYGWQQWGKK
uniref:Uncharacterized protein n=1 Tax=Plectus sambesii TaxID=2011161 RepID=A0A914XJ19_9BILA